MSVATVPVQQATIRQYAKDLKLATVGGQFLSMAEEAVKQKQGHLSYLEALLGAEVEDRYQHGVARRIKDAHFPKVKTLEDFAFCDAPHLPAAQIRNLAEGGYLSRSEPVIFLGETGTGKTHMATGLAIAACRQRKRVRFTTAAQLVNELTEAKNKSELNRVTNRWMRYELLVIDEMAYVAMPEAAAELLFQIIAGRAERSGVIVTTNLPFSEWTTMFPNARLCKAMLDRLTDQAHIIETGTESYRFRRTLKKKRIGHVYLRHQRVITLVTCRKGSPNRDRCRGTPGWNTTAYPVRSLRNGRTERPVIRAAERVFVEQARQMEVASNEQIQDRLGEAFVADLVDHQCLSRVRNGIAEKTNRTVEQQHAWEQGLKENLKPQARKLFRSALKATDTGDVRAPKGTATPPPLEVQLHEPLVALQR